MNNEFNNLPLEDGEIENIAEQVKLGYMLGRFEYENGKVVTWDLRTNTFNENDLVDDKPLTIRDIIDDYSQLWHYDYKWADSKNYKDLDEALEECGYKLTGDDDVEAGDYNDIKAYLNCSIECL